MEISRSGLLRGVLSIGFLSVVMLSFIRYWLDIPRVNLASISILFIFFLFFVIFSVREVSNSLCCLLFSLVFCVLFSFINGERAVFFSTWMFFSAFFAFSYLKYLNYDSVRDSRVLLYGFYAFFVFSGVLKGFAPNDVNQYLSLSSRNFLGYIAILLQVFYTLSFLQLNRTVPLVTPLVTLVICVVSYGRSSIAIAIFLVMLHIFHRFFFSKDKKKYLVFLFSMFLVFLFSIFYLNDFMGFITTSTNFSKGVDSPRWDMLEEYVMEVDLISFFTGLDTHGLPIISSFNGNPHNSFLAGHQYMGFAYVVFLFFLFFLLLREVFASGSLFVVSSLFIFLSIVVRVAFDTVALPGLFDIVVFVCFFHVMAMGSNFERCARDI